MTSSHSSDPTPGLALIWALQFGLFLGLTVALYFLTSDSDTLWRWPRALVDGLTQLAFICIPLSAYLCGYLLLRHSKRIGNSRIRWLHPAPVTYLLVNLNALAYIGPYLFIITLVGYIPAIATAMREFNRKGEHQ